MLRGERKRKGYKIKALGRSTLDPYVRVTLRPRLETHSTEVLVGGGTDVDFSSCGEFEFKIDGFPVEGKPQLSLGIEVMDDDGYFQMDDFIGGGKVDLAEAQKKPNEKLFKVLDLHDETETEYCGQIEFWIEWRPNSGETHPDKVTPPGKILVGLSRARHLRDTDEAGLLSLSRALLILFFFFLAGSLVMYYGEGYSATSSIYFCVVTLMTVGYGDVVPKTDGGKLFVAFYILVGIGCIAAALTYLTQWILRKKRSIQDEFVATEAALQRKLVQIRQHAMSKATKRRKSHEHPVAKTPESPTAEISMTELGSNRRMSRTEYKQKGTMEKVKLALVSSSALAIYFFLFNLFIGALAFCLWEDKSAIDGFYFSIVSLATVGYGDLTFTKKDGKIFSLFWLVIGAVSLARMLSIIIDARVAEHAEAVSERRTKRLLLRQTDFSVLDRAGKGKISRVEFLAYELVALGRCEQSQINEIMDRFDALDLDKSGYIEYLDFKIAQERQIEALRQRIVGKSPLKKSNTKAKMDQAPAIQMEEKRMEVETEILTNE